MSSFEDYVDQAHAVVADVVRDFHVTATLDSGTVVEVPVSYQIAEPGFRPFEKGKASPAQLQGRFDEIVAEAQGRGISLGLETSESVAKLLIQEGLGVDCSNFAYRALKSLQQATGLEPYEQTVQWPLDRVRKFHETLPFWRDAKDQDKNPRDFTRDELRVLEGTGTVSIEWIASVFGNDLEFIAGSAQMCSDDSSVSVEPSSLVPGDIVAFQSASSGSVSHLGIIEEIWRAQGKGSTRVNFWHSWHTRDFNGGGMRPDFVVVGDDGSWHFSHQGLNDPTRYQGYDFRRPTAVARHIAEITGVS